MDAKRLVSLLYPPLDGPLLHLEPGERALHARRRWGWTPVEAGSGAAISGVVGRNLPGLIEVTIHNTRACSSVG